MSQMTLSDLVTYVQDYLPDRPQAKVARAGNRVLQRIFNMLSVPERSTFTTKAKTTTGTVTTVTNSPSVTFTNSVLSASDPFCVVQIDTVSEWYNLTRVSDTTGTLSSNWSQTGAAGLAFTICYPVITYPSTVLSVRRRWQEGYKELVFAGDEKQEAPMGWQSAPGITAGRLSPGRPIWWAPYSQDSSGSPDDLRREMLMPWPDQKYTYEYNYTKRPTLFTPAGAGTQKTDLPAVWDQAIYDGTLYHSFIQENRNENAALWQVAYDKAFREALGEIGVVSRLGDGGQETGIWVEETWPVGGGS